ncbi:MAG: hypothetical protein F6J95_014795 [Leptolyngbya sp. SIO1E4]|nr:hypothetical protein [Leptolyngbya sp. SIO1E4]
MVLVICPGVHPALWTTQFLRQLDEHLPEGKRSRRVFPVQSGNPWSPYALRSFLETQAIAPATPLVFVAFSAGCVAAASIATHWAQQGRPVLAVVALDGWGVPMAGPYHRYRISHDAFTHHTSTYLGAGEASFYADPPVSHQQLWCSPAQVTGQQVGKFPAVGHSGRPPITALQFLSACLKQHPQALVSL